MGVARGIRRRLPDACALAAATAIGFITGCASHPQAGDVVHAQVNLRPGEALFTAALAARPDDGARNPAPTAALRALANEGATLEDARAGRLVLASCRWWGDSGAVFALRLPPEVVLPEGTHVEIALETGPELAGTDGVRTARYLRTLPYRSSGRTHCDPALLTE